jgi:hypothetical protein
LQQAGVTINQKELHQLLNTTKSETPVAGALTSDGTSSRSAELKPKEDPAAHAPNLPLLSSNDIGKLFRLGMLETRSSEVLVKYVSLLCHRKDASSEAEAAAKNGAAARFQRSELKQNIMALRKFEYGAEEIQETLTWLQRNNVQLPDGVSLDKLPYLPDAGNAWMVIKPKANKPASGSGLGTSVRIRLVSEIFRYWNEQNEGQGVQHGAVSGDFTKQWEKLEYLTPPGSFIKEFPRIVQFDTRLKLVVTQEAVDRIRAAQQGRDDENQQPSDEAVVGGGAESSTKKVRTR